MNSFLGYLIESIKKSCFHDVKASNIVKILNERIQRVKEYKVILKSIKLLRKLLEFNRSNIKLICLRYGRSSSNLQIIQNIKYLTTYSQGFDILKGNYYNQEIRKEAKLTLDLLLNSSNTSNLSTSQTQSQSQSSFANRIKGFGNTLPKQKQQPNIHFSQRSSSSTFSSSTRPRMNTNGFGNPKFRNINRNNSSNSQFFDRVKERFNDLQLSSSKDTLTSSFKNNQSNGLNRGINYFHSNDNYINHKIKEKNQRNIRTQRKKGQVGGIWAINDSTQLKNESISVSTTSKEYKTYGYEDDKIISSSAFDFISNHSETSSISKVLDTSLPSSKPVNISKPSRTSLQLLITKIIKSDSVKLRIDERSLSLFKQRLKSYSREDENDLDEICGYLFKNYFVNGNININNSDNITNKEFKLIFRIIDILIIIYQSNHSQSLKNIERLIRFIENEVYARISNTQKDILSKKIAHLRQNQGKSDTESLLFSFMEEGIKKEKEQINEKRIEKNKNDDLLDFLTDTPANNNNTKQEEQKDIKTTATESSVNNLLELDFLS